MKHIFGIIISFLLVTFLFSCSKGTKNNQDTLKIESITEKKRLEIDVKESIINWTIWKKEGFISGTIKIQEGSLDMKKGIVQSGQISIDMSSISIKDIKDSIEYREVLNYLKSKDYFDVEKYPVSTFEIRAVLPLRFAAMPDVNSTVKGNFTIKDSTTSMVLKSYINLKEDKLTARVKFDLSSTFINLPFSKLKFNKDYGQKSFKDNFDLDINLVAK